jgi:ABC-2 type transport system permease protein
VIRAVMQKEFMEWRRDGRVVGIASLIGLLVLVSLLTGWSTRTEQQREADRAQLDDKETFQKQGNKTPHSAAHFGRMAYKPVAALGVFDPGAGPYLGQVIWLEAHRRDPAMFRPAEDSPDLRRLADLSAAGVLTLLLPLLVFVSGHGSFAGERERGTLRQVLSIGPNVGTLFFGKIAATATISLIVSSIVIGVSLLVALMVPGNHSTLDTILRGCGLLCGYALYGIALAALAVFVSAQARTVASALLILLIVWAVSVVVLPRVAASVAERMYPTPNSTMFWRTTAEEIRARRPVRNSEEYRALERTVVGEALGREVTNEELTTLALNRQGLAFEIGERIDAGAYANAYDELSQTHVRQRQVRRFMSLVSPTLALQHLSSAFAGTDISAHEHFALAAERQRNFIVRRMNEDMLLRGAGNGFDYLAGPDLWARIPDFAYSPASFWYAMRSSIWDFVLLLIWSAIACWLAWRAAVRQSIV